MFIGPKSDHQSIMGYLDIANYPWAEDVRQYLNSWFQKIPIFETQDFIKRIYTTFEPAYFELFIHELFTQLGYSLEFHPEIPGAKGKPDFLATKSTDKLYLEATIVTEISDMERVNERKVSKLIDQINAKIRSQNFNIRVYNIEFINNSYSLKLFFRELRDYLTKLDPDEYIDSSPGTMICRRVPFRFYSDDIYIELQLIPRPKQLRTQLPECIVSEIGGRGKQLRTSDSIKAAVRGKKGKYGNPEFPLVICLNLTSPFRIHSGDVIDAFYGTGVADIHNQTTYRHNDGLIGTPDNPINTRISGLLVGDVNYTDLNNSSLLFYQNPYARYPIDFNGIFDMFQLRGGEVIRTDGKKLQYYINPLAHWLSNS